MKNYSNLFLIALLALASCEKPAEGALGEGPVSIAIPKITVEMPQMVSGPDSRTAMTEEHSMVWEKEDGIVLFPKSTSESYYKISSGVGSPTAQFSYLSAMNAADASSIPANIAVSPRKTANYNIELKDNLMYVRNFLVEYDLTYNGDLVPYSLPMLAVSSDNVFNFKHVASMLKFQLKASAETEGKSLKLIRLSCPSYAISGKFDVELNMDGSISRILNAGNRVIQGSCYGITLSDTPQAIYMPVVPQNSGVNLCLQLVTENGLSQKLEFVTSDKNVLKAGNILAMPVIEVNPTIKPVITLAENSKDVLAQSGLIKVAYSVEEDNYQPEIMSSDVPWIYDIEKTVEFSQKILTFSFYANDSAEARTGHVTLKLPGSDPVVYTLTQAGMEKNEDATGRLASAHLKTSAIRVDMPETQFTAATFETLLNLENYKSENQALSTIMGQEDQFMLRIGDAGVENGRIQVAVGNLNEAGEQSKGGKLTTVTALELNKWYHVAATIETKGAGILAKLYVNGNLESQEEFPDIKMPMLGGTGIYQKPNNSYNYGAKKMITIGGMPAFKWGDRWMTGMLAETRVWSVARTAEQIKSNMFTVDPATEGLEAYYKFNGTDIDAEGKNVTDAANKHNGVITGTLASKEHPTIVLD